jgi:MIP family channel proteins
MDRRLRACVAELLGTFALVFVGAGAVCAAYLPVVRGQEHPRVGGIALAQGCILAVALSATMKISGGYLNPAVTVTLWVFKRLEGLQAFALIVAQLLGAVLAGALLRLIFHQDDWLQASRLGTPHLKEGFNAPLSLGTLLGGIGIEVVLTFILTFVIFATTIDPRSLKMAGLGVGLVSAALTVVGFDLTGAATNPARWFGTVVWENTVPSLQASAWADHPVYWIGPILGALLAGAIYTTLILPEDARKTADRV